MPPQPLPPARVVDLLSPQLCRFCDERGTQYLAIENPDTPNPNNVDRFYRQVVYIITCRTCQNTMGQRGYTRCLNCNHWHYTLSDHEGYCVSCNTILTCQDCGNWFPHTHSERTRGAERNGETVNVCGVCRGLNYRLCTQCGDHFLPPSRSTAGRLCLYCIEDNEERDRERYDEDESDEEEYRDCSVKISSSSFKKNPYSRFVGFELEFLHKSPLLGIGQYGNIHDDGSIRIEGGFNSAEFASAPTNGDNLLDVIKSVTDIINKASSKVNNSCGFHVHLDMSTSTMTEQENIKAWWKVFEKTIFSFAAESRRGNTYSKFVNSMRGNSWDRDRYCSLNITALSKWSTFEVRLHHGTTNAEKISDWIMFLLGFFDVFSKIPLTEYRKRKVRNMTEREGLIFLFQQIKFPLTLKKKFVRRVKEYGQYISFSKEKKEIPIEKKSTPEVIQDAFQADVVCAPSGRIMWTLPSRQNYWIHDTLEIDRDEVINFIVNNNNGEDIA